MSLTSLIDVIFLLLLFFMLTTNFTRTGELAFAIGGSGERSDTAPVFVRLGADALIINGTGVGMTDAVAHIKALQDNGPVVLISTAPDVTAQRLADLLATLRTLHGARLQVLG